AFPASAAAQKSFSASEESPCLSRSIPRRNISPGVTNANLTDEDVFIATSRRGGRRGRVDAEIRRRHGAGWSPRALLERRPGKRIGRPARARERRWSGAAQQHELGLEVVAGGGLPALAARCRTEQRGCVEQGAQHVGAALPERLVRDRGVLLPHG